MEMLFRGLTQAIPEQEKVDIIIRGLRPEIKRAVAGDASITSIHRLRTATQRVEKLVLNARFEDEREIEAVVVDQGLPQEKKDQDNINQITKRTTSYGQSRANVKCHRCGRKGHYWRDRECPLWNQGNGQSRSYARD